MKTKTIAAVLPLALLLSACTTVEPAYKDIGTRSGSCVEGGPDTVAQKFYDLRIQQGSSLPDSNRLAQLQPYLSKVLYQDLVSAAQNPGKHRITGDLFSGGRQRHARHDKIAVQRLVVQRLARHHQAPLNLLQNGKRHKSNNSSTSFLMMVTCGP